MNAQPLFLSPNDQQADIIQVDRALESMRDAGFDLTAAIGEPLDNSIEADATVMRVLPVYGPRKKSIEKIIIADNGIGIDPSIMHHVLTMGYSTRYGQRKGLGRFGMGLKLAGLSLGERIDIYSKQATGPEIYHSYIDLGEIRDGVQKYITTSEVTDWPDETGKLMTGREGKPFSSGTIVVFSKIDRLSSGGTYGASLDEQIGHLLKFIARAYRTYIDTGRVFELGGKAITLHDPLFLRDNPRIVSRYKPLDPRGQVIEEADLEIDGHKVHVVVALVPQEFRPWSQAGGGVDYRGEDIREFQINDENTGKISFLRNGREIYYDIVPRLLTTGRKDKVLRYVAIEVSFPAELDDYFQVRNVKRGAEPVDKLRKQLRDWLRRPVDVALKEIRRHWNAEENRMRADRGEHSGSMDTASRVDPALPKGFAGRTVTTEDEERIIQEAIQDSGLDPDTDKNAIASLREHIQTRPITIRDGSWAGKEFIDIQHLNGRSLVKFNFRHSFFREVYTAVKEVADQGADGMSPEDVIDLARRAETAIDLLFMGYARAEGMYEDPAQFDDLRTYWGMFTDALLREQFKDR